jgi:hypothetical protein
MRQVVDQAAGNPETPGAPSTSEISTVKIVELS